MDLMTNRTFDELQVGDSASLERTLTHRDIELFAAVSGDVNPAHVDPEFAKTDIFHGVVVHGMLGAALISTVLGTKLPGPGTIYLDQTLQFRHPIRIGDTVTVTLTVAEKLAKGRVNLDCKAVNQKGEDVITGVATILAPNEKISRPRVMLPEVEIHENTGS
ncbi:MaoC/PaaZ C-terminal domain-containing protein [Hyphomicrobium sp.]|jgi:phosphate acetyltransferase/phosphate butyryltransferase|uniref:MaoC/PaaZ C-terminal domain-containing protein n=1 Tax=Hyphomicrobium sp. TaxID=82 RepID=UPI00356AEC97